jgi:hypothetical protein
MSVLVSSFLPDLRALRSASILNLDHIPVWIGEVCVGKRTPMITAHDQPSAKCRYRGDGAFVFLHTGQHITEMRHAALHASEVFLTRTLVRASSRVPPVAAGIQDQ